MSSDAFERINLQHFVTLEGFGIAGETRLKYCKSLLFRELNCLSIHVQSQSQSLSCFLRYPLFLIYIIYILLYINKL